MQNEPNRAQICLKHSNFRYKIKVEYVEGRSPRVYITEPQIEPRSEYHIYREGNLCLYDHREMPWSDRMLVHETIIPWTAEWLVFYELWKLTGEWRGLAAPHEANEKNSETK